MMTAIKMKRVNQAAPGIRSKNAAPVFYWMAIGAALFCAIAAVRAPGDHGTSAAPVVATPVPAIPATAAAPTQQVAFAATAALPEKSYTGVVVSADSKERLVTVKRGPFSKKDFNLGDNCAYSFLYSMLINNDGDGGVNNLRPGEKVTVSYQNAHGVLVADHIEQQPMRFAGVIKRIAPDKHTLILRRCVVFMQLDIATDCVTLLSNEKAGSLADIHPGDHVIIMYETPDCRPTAWEITKTSAAPPVR
jgi:hypothetical protein